MSTDQPAPHRVRARIALVSALSLGLGAIPLALGAPAQAASYACFVTPATPEYAYTQTNGVKVIDYKVHVYCGKGRYLNIEQERWERDDTSADDSLGTTNWSNQYIAGGQSHTFHNYRTLVDGESGKEDLYQKVKFQEGIDDLWSSWTGWKRSNTVSIAN
jgi:hypothetical protein